MQIKGKFYIDVVLFIFLYGLSFFVQLFNSML